MNTWTWLNDLDREALALSAWAACPRPSWNAWPHLAGQTWELVDLLTQARYIRDGDDLPARGLYLDMPGHGTDLFQPFQVEPCEAVIHWCVTISADHDWHS